MTTSWASQAVPFHPNLFDACELPGEHYRLIASRCRSCGQHAFPAKRFCSACYAGDMEMIHLKGLGRIYAFTRIAMPPKSMGQPYVAAYVDMDESVRIFGQIANVEAADLHIGDRVRVDFRPITTDSLGRAVVAYVFVQETEGSA